MTKYRSFLIALLAFALGASAAGVSTARSEHQNLSMADVPNAVKATILAEVLHECFDLEIARDEDDGEFDGVVFEVEFEHGEIEVELEISESGEVLEKEVSQEGDDEEDDDEDEDDDDD